ncbi:twin-arginine translocation signal domain-containing protein [Shewanella sp. WXL01]|uniref:Twin-arginine translocation signal domain-containing protein n=1 Tax=Shewanella maritima TaxID=2520507 RepID=A0A411PH74_9GAMM|nr:MULTISPECIES: twin-arginine translocation signal domain-containing protein [Shewanella]NKF52542.1 twin-arginine translocation signal domain-containing protein [Shewanella sp. WXL01]QBF82947.1 twin-arginine translocation signal domain-containing protein [Shewanella maritima]
MKKQASDMGRRQLLKALAIGGAAGAVASVSASASAAAPKVAAEPKSDNYRETEHIRRYYASLSK